MTKRMPPMNAPSWIMVGLTAVGVAVPIFEPTLQESWIISVPLFGFNGIMMLLGYRWVP